MTGSAYTMNEWTIFGIPVQYCIAGILLLPYSLLDSPLLCWSLDDWESRPLPISDSSDIDFIPDLPGSFGLEGVGCLLSKSAQNFGIIYNTNVKQCYIQYIGVGGSSVGLNPAAVYWLLGLSATGMPQTCLQTESKLAEKLQPWPQQWPQGTTISQLGLRASCVISLAILFNM